MTWKNNKISKFLNALNRNINQTIEKSIIEGFNFLLFCKSFDASLKMRNSQVSNTN